MFFGGRAQESGQRQDAVGVARNQAKLAVDKRQRSKVTRVTSRRNDESRKRTYIDWV